MRLKLRKKEVALTVSAYSRTWHTETSKNLFVGSAKTSAMNFFRRSKKNLKRTIRMKSFMRLMDTGGIVNNVIYKKYVERSY